MLQRVYFNEPIQSYAYGAMLFKWIDFTLVTESNHILHVLCLLLSFTSCNDCRLFSGTVCGGQFAFNT